MSARARTVFTLTLAVTLLSAASAHAQETRAGLDPALVEGRGAAVSFAEQEAENAVHTGELLSASATGDIASYDPDRRGSEQRAAYTLSAEASGRDAVRLDPGEHVEFRLTRAANAITVRYSIPDAPQGGGIRSPLRVSVDGRHAQEMTPDVGIRVAVRRLSVLERPEQRLAAPRLVASADREPRRSRTGRTTSTTSSACCCAGPTGPATPYG